MAFDLFTEKSNGKILLHLQSSNGPVIMPLSHPSMANAPYMLMLMQYRWDYVISNRKYLMGWAMPKDNKKKVS